MIRIRTPAINLATELNVFRGNAQIFPVTEKMLT